MKELRIFNSQLNENEKAKWTLNDEWIKTMKIGVDPSGQTFVLSNGFGNLLICQFFDGQFKLEFVDLAQKLGESNLQVALSLHFPINIPSFLQKRLLTFVCQIRTNSFCWPFPEGFSVLADSIRPLPHSLPSLLRPK